MMIFFAATNGMPRERGEKGGGHIHDLSVLNSFLFVATNQFMRWNTVNNLPSYVLSVPIKLFVLFVCLEANIVLT